MVILLTSDICNMYVLDIPTYALPFRAFKSQLLNGNLLPVAGESSGSHQAVVRKSQAVIRQSMTGNALRM